MKPTSGAPIPSLVLSTTISLVAMIALVGCRSTFEEERVIEAPEALSVEPPAEPEPEAQQFEELMRQVRLARRQAWPARANGVAPEQLQTALDAEWAAFLARERGDTERALEELDNARTAYASALARANLAGTREHELDAREVSPRTLPELFHVPPQLNAGVLRLHYDRGPDFRQDISVEAGSQFMVFEGDDNVGFAVGDYVLAGNTEGLVFLDAVFADGVEVEFDLHLQLALPDNPSFYTLIMAENPSSYYAANFGTNIQVFESKQAPKKIPSRNKSYNQNPARWISKREPHQVKFKYRKASEDEAGLLQTWYDGELTCEVRTDKYRRGRIGFAWHNVKFIMRNLEVTGHLDEEWVRETLAGKR